MPVISCEVKYGGRIGRSDVSSAMGIAALLPAEWNRALKETWAEIGHYFHARFVEKHFTKAGADEYRAENVAYGEVAVDDTYRPRSGEGESGKAFWSSYNGRKQKQFGQQLAMVFSGNTKNGAKRATIYATSKGVRVALPGCVHLNQYKPKPKKYGPHAGEPPINLRGDLLAISRREAEEIRALHERLMVQKFGNRLGWLAVQRR